MSRKKRRNSNSALKRICQRFFIFLLIIGIPIILVASSFQIKNVTVLGSERYTPEEMKEEIIKSKLDTNALYLYLKYQYFTNVTIPFVEKVDVELEDNHSVTIYVYEKMVIGCVEFMGEYLYFDKDGIIVESLSKRLGDIPLIGGLKYSKIILNEKLEVLKKELKEEPEEEELKEESEDQKEELEEELKIQKEELNEKNEIQSKELFNVILNLTQLIEKFALDVDTISFSNNYEVTLDCGDIKVLLGEKSTYDEALSEMKNILAVAEGKKLEIDMRNYVKGTNAIIAKPKE